MVIKNFNRLGESGSTHESDTSTIGTIVSFLLGSLAMGVDIRIHSQPKLVFLFVGTATRSKAGHLESIRATWIGTHGKEKLYGKFGKEQTKSDVAADQKR